MSTAAVPEWTLGWRLQRALAHADMTTQTMADELGVTRSTISRWTNDHGAPPRAIYVKQWALRTGVPYEWLAYGTADSTPPDQGNRTSGWKSDHLGRGQTSAASRHLHPAA